MTEAHIIAFNEAETIHLTIKHYQKFCSSIIIWDNHSTDDTQDIAKSMGCKVKTFGRPGELSDRSYMELKNECWKKNHPGIEKRDFVVVCDADEILCEYTIDRGSDPTTIFKTQGFNIFSHDIPKDDWLEIQTGVYDDNYSKVIMFDPSAITDINYRIGCHVASPRGNVIWGDSHPLLLLHYRNVGGPQRLVDRHNLYRPRMSEENLQRNWGHHYLISDEERVKEWEEKFQKSRPL